MLTIHEENINEFLDDLTEKVIDKLTQSQEFLSAVVKNLWGTEEFIKLVAKQILEDDADTKYFAYNVACELVDSTDFDEPVRDAVHDVLDYEDLAVWVVDRLKDVFKKLNEEA